MYDIASSPNDPVFIHHLMLDCILLEWAKRHSDTEYPIHSLIRDRHRKRDFVCNYFPLVTNDEVLFTIMD